MVTKSRKAFSADLKARVALEAVRGQKTVNEIGQEFGVHPTQVGVWHPAPEPIGVYGTLNYWVSMENYWVSMEKKKNCKNKPFWFLM